jgi:hypothetical protein
MLRKNVCSIIDRLIITGHIEDKGIGLPINMMLVDAKGKALNIIIQKPTDKYEIPNRIGHA